MYMRGRMVLIFSREPFFNLNKICMMEAPIWVDLLTLNPVFEDSALRLLRKVGKVVYAASKYARSKFSNVQGCVKVDLTHGHGGDWQLPY